MTCFHAPCIPLNRITQVWRLEDTLGGVPRHTQSRVSYNRVPGTVSEFCIFQGWKSTALPSNLVQCLMTITVTESILPCLSDHSIPVFQVVLIALCHLLATRIRCLYLAFSSQGCMVPAFSASPCMTDAPSPSWSFWLFAGLAPGCPSLSCTREPTTSQTWRQKLAMSHPHWENGTEHLLQPAGNTLCSAPHDTIGLLCFKGTLLPYGQLGVYLEHQGFICQAALQLVSPQHDSAQGYSQAKSLVLPLAELYEVLICPFVQPVEIST